MKKLLVFSIIVLLLSVFLTSGEIYKIIKPESSSKWARGSTKIIKWDKKGDTYPNVKIRLYTSPGNVKAQDISNSTVNNESFEWKIPAGTVLGKYFVRVKTLNNLKWGDGDEFEIVKGSVIEVGVLKDVIKKVGQKPTFKPSKGMFNPKIISSLPAPIGPMRPGSRLFVIGKNFGKNKGKILLKGNFPGGHIELENVTWVSDTKVNGYVPQSANGQPNQNVHPIVVSSYNFKSDPGGSRTFEGREEKVLFCDVVGVNCGNDGNCNYCNNVGGCGSQFIAGCPDEYAICGFHDNNWGAVGDDVGNDVFSINLKNGWVFKSMQKEQWKKSSGDEKLSGPSPSFPTGQSNWTAVISWKVTPNDHVAYRIKILVEGPIGTNYK